MTEGKPVLVLLMPFALDPQEGGVQRVTWQLGQYFSLHGWKVVYVSLSSRRHIQPKNGVLEYPPRDLRGGAARVTPIRRFLEEVFLRHRPDLVINQAALYGTVSKVVWGMSEAGRQFSVIGCYHNSPAQYVTSLTHSLRYRFRKFPRWRRLIDIPFGRALLIWQHKVLGGRLYRTALSRCQRLVLLSPTYFDELRWFVAEAQQANLAAIPNGFPRQQAPDWGGKCNRLLYVGRMDNQQKNIFALTEIWEKVYDKLPDWELHLVGDGPDRAELESAFSSLNLPRVVFHGQGDPIEHYRAAKLFLMVSAYEGFGNTLIEAQMQGVVPIAYDTYSALRMILRDGENARVIPPRDLDAYAGAILALAGASERLREMADQAVHNAQRFSEDAIGKQWDALLADVCSNRPSEASV